MEKKWHVIIDGQTKGPFASLAIHNLKKQGRINDDSYIWAEGMKDWVPIKTIKELQYFDDGTEQKSSIPQLNSATNKKKKKSKKLLFILLGSCLGLFVIAIIIALITPDEGTPEKKFKDIDTAISSLKGTSNCPKYFDTIKIDNISDMSNIFSGVYLYYFERCNDIALPLGALLFKTPNKVSNNDCLKAKEIIEKLASCNSQQDSDMDDAKEFCIEHSKTRTDKFACDGFRESYYSGRNVACAKDFQGSWDYSCKYK